MDSRRNEYIIKEGHVSTIGEYISITAIIYKGLNYSDSYVKNDLR